MTNNSIAPNDAGSAPSEPQLGTTAHPVCRRDILLGVLTSTGSVMAASTMTYHLVGRQSVRMSGDHSAPSTFPDLRREAPAQAKQLLPRRKARRLFEPRIGDGRVSLYNANTGERITVNYWENGAFDDSSLAAIDRVLRDHHAGIVREIDTRLLDMLSALHKRLDPKSELHVLSAFRAPETNRKLSHRYRSTSDNSYHMEGQAADLWVPGVMSGRLRRAAQALRAGGVGYYGDQLFVHLDTGPVRYW